MIQEINEEEVYKEFEKELERRESEDLKIARMEQDKKHANELSKINLVITEKTIRFK